MANENQLRAEQLKEELARKYRQPKGVEQFGIEAVPPELKTAHWWDLFNIIINFLIQPGMMVIAGLAIASGLPFGELLLLQFLVCLLHMLHMLLWLPLVSITVYPVRLQQGWHLESKAQNGYLLWLGC